MEKITLALSINIDSTLFFQDETVFQSAIFPLSKCHFGLRRRGSAGFSQLRMVKKPFSFSAQPLVLSKEEKL